MTSRLASLFIVSALIVLTSQLPPCRALAQSGPIELDESAPAEPAQPTAAPTVRPGAPVGRHAAEKYMSRHEVPYQERTASANALSPTDHYLALHLGAYVSDNAYKWGGHDSQNNVGDATAGITYRVGEWQHSMDLALRFDYSAYSLDDGNCGKISFLPMITFPDAASRFPLYLGGGVGIGVFTKQIDQESALSFDYQVVLGARFFEVLGNTGFFIEAGLKNHILLLTDGQFNGTFVAFGPVFTF